MLNALHISKSVMVGEGVLDLCLSPSGEQFAVCTESSVVSIFNSDDLELVGEFPTTAAKCVCYSPDGRLLAVQRDKQAIVLLDTTSLAVTAEIATSRMPRVRCLAFSHDGSMLAGAGFSEPFLNKGIVIVWNAATGEPMHEINEDVDLVPRMEFYSDDKSLFIQGYKTGFLVLDTETWTEISRHEEFMLEIGGISPDARKLLVAKYHSKLELYDTLTATCEKTFECCLDTFPTVLAWAPDLRIFVAGFFDGSIYPWNSSQDEKLGVAVTDAEVRSLVVSPNGRTFVLGHASGEVTFWALPMPHESKPTPTLTRSIAEITETNSVKAHRSGSQNVHFSPDGNRIISGGGDCYVRVWETLTLAKQWSAGTIYFTRPRCTPDGKNVICNYDCAKLRQWDMETKKIITHIELPERQSVDHFDFTPDGKTMITFGSASGRYGILSVWNIDSREATMKFSTRHSVCWDTALTRDGKYLYSAATGAITKWDVATTNVLASAKFADWVCVLAIAVTPNGEFVYTSSGTHAQGCEIRCWTSDLQLRGAILATVPEYNVTCLAISPDGQTLASGASDKLVRLWDVNSHEQKALLRGHTKSVDSVDFSPDGKSLVTGSSDGQIKTWDVSSVC